MNTLIIIIVLLGIPIGLYIHYRKLKQRIENYNEKEEKEKEIFNQKAKELINNSKLNKLIEELNKNGNFFEIKIERKSIVIYLNKGKFKLKKFISLNDDFMVYSYFYSSVVGEDDYTKGAYTPERQNIYTIENLLEDIYSCILFIEEVKIIIKKKEEQYRMEEQYRIEEQHRIDCLIDKIKK
jgi:hypothetical protein